MNKRYIDRDEWWPVYSAYAPGETFAHLVDTVEFSDAEIARIDAAFDEFYDVQELIRTRYEASKEKR